MASLSEIYMKTEVVETMLKTLQAKGEKGIKLTIALNDEANQYGQNVSAYVAQSKEDREAQKKRYYVGNGKTFWNDGKITNAPKQDEKPAEQAQVLPEDDGLPF